MLAGCGGGGSSLRSTATSPHPDGNIAIAAQTATLTDGVGGATALTLSTPAVTVAPGQEVIVPVSVGGALGASGAPSAPGVAGVAGAALKLELDGTVFTCAEVTPGEWAPPRAQVVANAAAAAIAIAGTSASPAGGQASVVARFRLRALPTARPQTATLKLTGALYDATGASLGRTARQAPAAVRPQISNLIGDLLGTGRPEVGSAIKILRVVVTLDPQPPAANLWQWDCNASGVVDVGDAIKILRCVVGLDAWPIIVPPTAVITVTEGSRATAGATLHVSAAGSTAPGGTVNRWQWQVQQPTGNGATLQPNYTSRDATLVANTAGTYIFTLEVWDNGDRKSAPATAEVTVVPPGTVAIRVRLTWVTPGDPDETDTGPGAGSDMDLHFLHPNAPSTQKYDVDGDGHPDPYFDGVYDCFWFNPDPVWSSSSPRNQGSNPRLERDDTDGGGPEIIALDSPPDNLTYHIAVHYWGDHGYGSARPTVRILIDGVERFADTAPLMAKRDLWKVAQLAWPSAAITPFRSGSDYVVLHNYVNPSFMSLGASAGLAKP